VAVADKLFRGRVLEEKIFAVFLLENHTDELGEREFKLFGRWLDRVSTWADHDGLVQYLIGPMIAFAPRRAKVVFQWANHRTAGTAVPLLSRSSAPSASRSAAPKSCRSRTRYSPTKTTWSK